MQGQTSGNVGLVADAAAHPVAPGFCPLAVTAIDQESEDVLSLTMRARLVSRCPRLCRASQFWTLRCSVSGVVVGDQVNFFSAWRDLVDHTQEFQPLLVAAPTVAHADHGAIESAHGRKLGCGSLRM